MMRDYTNRRQYFGSGDAAAVLGIGFKTRLRLWTEKTGRVEEEPGSERMLVGGVLEAPLLDLFEGQTEYRLVQDRERLLVVDPADDRFAAHLDGRVDDETYVEAKTIGYGSRAHRALLDDRISNVHYAQIQHVMMCDPRLERCLYWALDPYFRLHLREIERDDTWVRAYRLELTAFAEDVEADREPAAFAADRALLKTLYPQTGEASHAVGPKHLRSSAERYRDWFGLRESHRAELKAVETVLDQYRADLEHEMAREALTSMAFPGTGVFYRRTAKNGSVRFTFKPMEEDNGESD